MPRHPRPGPTIAEAAAALAEGRTTSRALVEAALERAAAVPLAFTRRHAERARAEAAAQDSRRRAGHAASPLAGIPVTVKDLFDEAGEVTRAASLALGSAPPATADAPAVARLRAAGMVVIGRTNMSEFAFSGLGVNPHFGTPTSPWDRATGRLPGGSSSGAAVAAAEGAGCGGLGTDTGGSCRIPAALCGVVGFKPTATRVPLAGVVPLAPSLDSAGPLACSVACCAALDAVIAGEPARALPEVPLAGRRFVNLTTHVTAGVEPAVARAHAAALRRLEAAGAAIEDLAIPELEELPALNARGGLTALEAFRWHRPLIEAHAERYDPRILARIRRGEHLTEQDEALLRAARAAMIAAVAARTAGFDAVLCPTVPLLPPPLAAIADAAEYGRINVALLRNPLIANFLDRCAISIPCHAPGEAPVGLMLMGERGGDAALLALAAACEAALAT